MFGDDLNVRVTSSTADFTAGMETAERGLSSVRSDALKTAGAMQVLQGRMDEAGDEATTAGAKAGASSGGFTSLAASAATTEVSFSSLSVVTATTLIPSLLALSTIVAPLVAALGGFITVAASIGGLGLAGFIGAIATNGEMLKSTFNDLVSTIKTEFAPVFDLFAVTLDMLMQDLAAIIPELAPAQTVIERMVSQFDLLGVAIIEALPAFMDLAVTLTQQFLPPFARWVDDILPRVPGMLQGLIPTMVSVGQALGPLVDAFIEIAPTMTEFGMTVLNIVVPALESFLGIWNDAMVAVNEMRSGSGELVTTLTILGPVIATIATTVAGLSAPVLAVAGAVTGLALAFQQDFGGIRGTVRTVASDLQRVLGSNLPTYINNMKRILGTVLPVVEPIFGALARFIGVALVNAIDLGLTAVTALSQVLVGDFSGALETVQGFIGRWQGRVKSLFGGLASSIKTTLVNGAISAVSILVAVYQKGFNKIRNAIAGIWNGIMSDLVKGMNSVVDVITDRLNSLIGRINSGIQRANKAPGVDMDTLGSLEAPELSSQPAMLNANRTTDIGQLAQQNEQTIRVVLDERTDIVEGRIQDGAERVVEDKERRTQRNTGRNPNPS